MTQVLTFHNVGQGRIAGWHEPPNTTDRGRAQNLEKAHALITSESSPTCTLVLNTLVANVEVLSTCTSFVARNSQHLMDYPHTKVTIDNGNIVHVILDCPSMTTRSTEDQRRIRHRLVVVGEGRRLHMERPQMELVVLLVKQSGEYFERIGLTTVRSDIFRGNSEWIQLI